MQRCAIETVYNVHSQLSHEHLDRECTPLELCSAVHYAQSVRSPRLDFRFEVLYENVYDLLVSLECSEVNGLIAPERLLVLCEL